MTAARNRRRRRAQRRQRAAQASMCMRAGRFSSDALDRSGPDPELGERSGSPVFCQASGRPHRALAAGRPCALVKVSRRRMAPPPANKARRAAGAAKAATAAAGSGDDLRRTLAWLNSYPKVSRWMARYDIGALVDAGGGLAVVPDFLPPFVAEGALRIMERLPPGRWKPTEAQEDYTHNNIAHAFLSVKGGMGGAGPERARAGVNEELEALLRAFTLLLPDQLNAFSAARYERGHHIAPHDDRAYTPVMMDTGEVVTCSRDMTCVYYLTKDWTKEMGGALVDLESPPEDGEEGWEEQGDAAASQQQGTGSAADGGREQQGTGSAADGGSEQQGSGSAADGGSEQQGSGSAADGGSEQQGSGGAAGAAPAQHPAQRRRGRLLVPRFNSAVFFRVPRWHAVTPLTTDRPRFSVFGWFLQPGKLYDLHTGEEEQQQGAQQGQLPAPPAAQGREDGSSQLAADGAAAARGKRRKKRRKQPAEGQPEGGAAGEEDGQAAGSEGPLHCKLAQRLLAKVAAKQRRQNGADG